MKDYLRDIAKNLEYLFWAATTAIAIGAGFTFGAAITLTYLVGR